MEGFVLPIKIPLSDQSVPPPHEGIQVNFCKNMDSSHFGSPVSTEKQPRVPGANERPNDVYILGSKGGFRTRLICKSCRQYSNLKSNKAIHEEYTLYGHFLFLRRLLGNVGKFRFYLDQDSGMRAACLSAFCD